MMCQPLQGWRQVRVTDRRTRLDYAECLKELLDVHFPRAEKLLLVQDNLNTHSGGSLYERFPPQEALRILNRIEFHYTPKHGSWLNMAETELRVLSRQCLTRRLDCQTKLVAEVATWEKDRNARKVRVHWSFTRAAARRKLRKVYPSIEV
jgi:DDE superfamily endonuclease